MIIHVQTEEEETCFQLAEKTPQERGLNTNGYSRTTEPINSVTCISPVSRLHKGHTFLQGFARTSEVIHVVPSPGQEPRESSFSAGSSLGFALSHIWVRRDTRTLPRLHRERAQQPTFWRGLPRAIVSPPLFAPLPPAHRPCSPNRLFQPLLTPPSLRRGPGPRQEPRATGCRFLLPFSAHPSQPAWKRPLGLKGQAISHITFNRCNAANES